MNGAADMLDDFSDDHADSIASSSTHLSIEESTDSVIEKVLSNANKGRLSKQDVNDLITLIRMWRGTAIALMADRIGLD